MRKNDEIRMSNVECRRVPGGVHPARGARGECAADEREPLIPTTANALTAARFPAFALARFGFAGDNGSPNLGRLPIMGECSASKIKNSD